MSYFKIILFSIFLLGCAGNQRCNPELDKDFFSAVGCSISGGYENSVNQARNNLIDEKIKNDSLNEKLGIIDSEKEQLKKDIKKIESSLFKIESELDELDEDLVSSENEYDKLQRQVTKIRREIALLKESKMGDVEDRILLESLKEQKDKLQDAVEYLLSL